MEWSRQKVGRYIANTLPAEILYKIFERLDPSTVKSCRLVCSYWNSVLIYGQRRILTKGICSVYRTRNVRFTTWKCIKCQIQAKLFGVKVNESRFPFLLVNSLRITEVSSSSGGFQLRNWIRFYKLQNITCVELLKCKINVSTIMKILKLTNLEELSLLDVKYVGLVNEWGYEDESKTSSIRKMQKSLKKLRVRERDLWALYSHRKCPLVSQFNILLKALALGTKNLETLIIECFDTGNTILDFFNHFKGLFNILFTFMSRNASTLKSVTFSTYNVEDGRRFNNINRKYWDFPENSFDIVFNSFIRQFEHKQANQIELPNLEELSLRFRIVDVEHPNLIRPVFLPWLKRLKKLKEFRLSQIGIDIIERRFHPRPDEIRNVLPQNCHCVLETFSRSIAWSFDNQISLEDMEDNLKHLKNKADLLAEPSSYRCPPPGVLGYNDSIVQMKTDQTDLTNFYDQSKSLADIQFYTQNLLSLKEIRIQQCGVYETDKIKITDWDLERIWSNCLELTHLKIEFCNLSDVSDSGLTGISPTARARMIANNDYNIQPGDLIGPSLSRLKELRVLKLSCVGNRVTDVTGYHACSSFPRVLTGGISGKHNKYDIYDMTI